MTRSRIQSSTSNRAWAAIATTRRAILRSSTRRAACTSRACLRCRTNQPLEIKNTDPVTHNVHPMPRENRSWNRSLPEGAPPFMTKFPHQELGIPVACNIHPWMRAFLFVFDNPYYDMTTKTGTFELKNLPPGTYTIEAWHEYLGTLNQTVTVAPRESKAISFRFTASH